MANNKTRPEDDQRKLSDTTDRRINSSSKPPLSVSKAQDPPCISSNEKAINVRPFSTGPWKRRYAHAFGRIVASCLFAALVTCATAPGALELVAPNRTVAMHDDSQRLDHFEDGLKVKRVIPPVPSEDASEPFGLGAVPIAIGDVPAKWREVEGDIRGDMDILARCRVDAEDCPPRARRFLAIVDEGRARDGRARIGVINRAINLAIQPMSDLAQWGVIDHWSSPLETFLTGRGDCEDYAIAKYVALVEAGVAEDDVKLVVERDLATKQDHAVVVTRLDGDWIVLDNRWFALAEDVELRRMVPLFVMDRENVKQFASNDQDHNIRILADSLEVAPAGIPRIANPAKLGFVTEEPSKARSRDSWAFLDRLTNSVDSGNLLDRRLTIEHLRDYAMRTYYSRTADR